MNTCSDSFWFWFMRPIAEALGAIALIAAVMAIIGVFFMILEWKQRSRK